MNTRTFATSTITAALLAAAAPACDFCGCDLPNMSLQSRPGWHVGVSEQYTYFGSLHMDGHSIANPADQFMHSSITQLIIGYDFSKALGIQLNAPILYRSFRRVNGGVVETGSVSGFGDMSLLGHWIPFSVEKGDFRFAARVTAGVKFPTGDSKRVLEEAAEGDEEGGDSLPSGIHGHDITLGTGGVDGIFGADFHLQWKRLFLDGGIEYTARGGGRHEYDYADGLNWRASAGVIAVEKTDFKLAVAVAFEGGTKGEDVFRGVRATDTSATIVFMGPKVVATWRDRLHADVGVSFPILRENSGVQSVPDYRIQASVGWQF